MWRYKMSDMSDVYRELQKHLNNMPVGYPPTKSGVEISLLKKLFSPEQAKIALHLDYKHKALDQIFETSRTDVESMEELKQQLDEIVSKGGIFRRKIDGEVQYAIIPFVLWGMYEHQLKRLDPEFLKDTGEYLMGEFGLEMATTRIPKMRVIPVNKSVKVEHHISTYDELRHLIKQAGDRITIQECICKKVNDLNGKNCQETERREVCMSMGDLADLYADEGWGRKITQEEALEIARKNEEEGLVLMPSNEKAPAFICACCSDCCGMLSLMKTFPKPAEVVASNYYSQVNPEICKGSGICTTRCKLEAIQVKDGKASVDMNRCIGCGLCVTSCPEHAISLMRKEKEVIPLETMEDRFDEELTKKSTLTGKIRNHALKGIIRVMTRLSKDSKKQQTEQ